MSFRRYVLAPAALLLMAGCNDAGGTAAKVFSDIQYFNITKKAEEEYPQLPKHEAHKRFANAEFDRMYMAFETGEERRALAAAYFLGFSALNGRAIPEYCGEMNRDLSKFADGFEQQNRRELKAYRDFLETQGMTEDAAWAKVRRRAMSAAKFQLMEAGGLSKGSWGVCKDVEDNPFKYLARAKFADTFPSAARVLNAAPQS